ncbi:lipoprotein signal peptidase [Blattabacterium cuenoti]|uniref:lipoprotein signal peptidase n=1 Tax=Blattabacterium cuenoti TaxID=1653831 RepID=UPI00163BAB41|nr:lipoprotein signal peptidase [Blattabacterium cuenoti]
MRKFFLIILPIILVDQFLKIYVKTHFELGNGYYIFSFFRIFFIENPGMLYGIIISSGYNGKILLSIIRFFLVLFILFFYIKNERKNINNYLSIPISFILSGSIGNFLDSFIYGKLFNTGTIYSKEYGKWVSYSGISKLNFFTKNGYSSLMEGCVVDIFYFPIIDFIFPKSIPFIGGYNFKFFKPVFNLSDAAIFIGIILIFFFKKKINKVNFF